MNWAEEYRGNELEAAHRQIFDIEERVAAMKRALVQISSVEIDWLQGLLSAGEAMLAISVILKNSKEISD